MAGKFIKFFAPFVRIMPEVKQPQREVTFKQKFIATAIVLVLYLIMSNIRLYGVPLNQGTDSMYWMRIILASQRGTLTELGIGPIVTAGLIMQLLLGSKLINVDMSDPYDRSMFSGSQKVMGMFMTIFQGIMYLIGGQFGDLAEIGLVGAVLIFLQLVFAGMVIILLDEVLQKGWGLGSGVSLFIATGVAGQIFWNSFSFITGSDGLAYGAVIALIQALVEGISNSSNVIEELQGKDPDHEIILPIGNYVKIKAKVPEPEKVLVYIERNIIVEQDSKQALDYLRKKRDEIQKQQDIIELNVKRMSDRFQEVDSKLKSFQQGVRPPTSPQ